MIDAIAAGERLRKEELHLQELPVANLACLQANMNRDAEARKDPFPLSDFCFYRDSSDQDDKPDTPAAAAYMWLIDQGLLPNWALFCFGQLETIGRDKTPPMPPAALGEGVIVLAPKETDEGLVGLLLASQDAAGTDVVVVVGDRSFLVAVPGFADQVIARDNALLPVLREL